VVRSVVTANCSPAPSQSAHVTMGVWMYRKPWSLKNLAGAGGGG
jgi:hypothetical protein